MAILTATKALDMLNISSSFEFISEVTIISPTLIGGLTAAGQLQEYPGTFDLVSIAFGNYATSTASGFRQYEGSSSATPLEYELKDASIPGNVLQGFLDAGDEQGLTAYTLQGDDTINGSAFDDVLTGLEANDLIYTNDGSDTAVGGKGNDRLYGGRGSDTLQGGTDNDSILAGNGNDLLLGGAGNDNLKAGKGVDTLIGGEGADTFTLSAGLD